MVTDMPSAHRFERIFFPGLEIALSDSEDRHADIQTNRQRFCFSDSITKRFAYFQGSNDKTLFHRDLETDRQICRHTDFRLESETSAYIICVS